MIKNHVNMLNRIPEVVSMKSVTNGQTDAQRNMGLPSFRRG